MCPFQGAQKGGPFLKMAMFEEDIWDKGPRATSVCSTAGISPVFSVEVIVNKHS